MISEFNLSSQICGSDVTKMGNIAEDQSEQKSMTGNLGLLILKDNFELYQEDVQKAV